MADSTTTNESITEIVPKVLAAYLKTNVTGIAQTYDEFPAASVKMSLPAISVFASSDAEFRPLAPYQVLPLPAPDVANKANVKWVVGIYDFKLQLDLWARNKEERDDLFDALFNALNPNISPMGLVLPMTEYFNQLCDYVYVGHSFADTEERAQRDEWRVTLSVLVTCKAIRQRSEFIIVTTPTAPEIEAEGQIDTVLVVPD